MTRKECYKIFGFEDGVVLSDQLIKSKYRELSKKYHPDNLNGDIEKLKKVNDAYEVLINRKFDDFNTNSTSSSDYEKMYNMYKNANFEANHYKNLYNSVRNNSSYTTSQQTSKKETKTKNIWDLFNKDIFTFNNGLKAFKSAQINSKISFYYTLDKFLFVMLVLFYIFCAVAFVVLVIDSFSWALVIGSLIIVKIGSSAINSGRRSLDWKIQRLQYQKSKLL